MSSHTLLAIAWFLVDPSCTPLILLGFRLFKDVLKAEMVEFSRVGDQKAGQGENLAQTCLGVSSRALQSSESVKKTKL